MKNETNILIMIILVGLFTFFLGRNNAPQPPQIQGFSQPTAIQANQPNAPKTEAYKAKYKWNFTKEEGEAYIENFKGIAIEEQREYKIFASITLSQGLLESGAGGSKLATTCKNHFGIKCFSKRCKKGHCHNFEDDSHKDFFLNFKTAWYSFREHSKLLQKSRYRAVLSAKTPESAAVELRKSGYATDKNYEKKITDLINIFNLKQYDL